MTDPSSAVWHSDRLGNVATLQRGFDLPARLRSVGNFPVVTSSGITSSHNQAAVSGPGVVTGRYGTIGQTFFLNGDFWPHNTTLFVSDFHGNDPQFIYYLLKTVDFASHSGKSGVPGVNRNDLHKLQIAVPADINVQRHIATVLATADEAVSTLELLITKKQSIKNGIVQQLLTGDTRLAGFTSSWTAVTLGDVSRIKTGTRNSQDKDTLGRYPFFVRSATVERINSYSHDCEAILIPGEGGIGSIFHYFHGKFEVHQRVYKISDFAADVSGRFVYFYLRHFFGAHAVENSMKATVDSLRLPTFRDFRLFMPSEVSEQRRIAEILDDAEADIAVQERRLNRAKAVGQGMMQELLTGRTRPAAAEGTA